METCQRLEVHHMIPQEKDLLQMMVNIVVCCFPLLGEDDVVLLNGILDIVGRFQHLLLMLLGVSFNTMNLCCMGSPLHLSIIHLQAEC